jgi:hypothetical protein
MALADITEATPETSSDDIKEFVEQLAQEVKQERKGEPEKKSDAQITSEQAGTPQPGDKPKETPAENKSGSDTALEEGEETGDAPESPEWLTDEVKAEASAYGIEESEIADFASREELDRALRLLDKTALEAGRKAKTESEDIKVRNERGQFAKKEEPKAEPPKEETPKDGRYQVSLSADLYDEEIIGEFTRMRDHYESRLEAMESRFAETDAVAKERHFDSLVDSLGHADLFGATNKETAQEKQRRADLFDEVETYLAGRKALGRPAELNETIVNRIARSLFGEELRKKELKQHTRKISRQSDGRQGGSPVKPLPPSDNPRDEADRLYRELERK